MITKKNLLKLCGDVTQRDFVRHISKLQVTIEPWCLGKGMKELQVETIVNGEVHHAVIPFEPDDFESIFDSLMERSKSEILRLVKANRLPPC